MQRRCTLKPEQRTQIAILEWMALQYPIEYGYVVRIGNEGTRSIAGHVLAKRMGLNVGASDLFIAWPVMRYHGLWLEIKPDGWRKPRNENEKLHIDRQMYFINKMKARGFYATMSVGTTQGINTIDRYLRHLL